MRLPMNPTGLRLTLAVALAAALAGCGDDDVVRLQRGDAGEVDLVVADDFDLLAQLAEILHEVVGEAVVVVDH